MTQKAQATKKKGDKFDFKIRKFCVSKDTIKKMKGQPTKWDKCLHFLYVIRIQSPEYIKNLYKSIAKRQITQAMAIDFNELLTALPQQKSPELVPCLGLSHPEFSWIAWIKQKIKVDRASFSLWQIAYFDPQFITTFCIHALARASTWEEYTSLPLDCHFSHGTCIGQ